MQALTKAAESLAINALLMDSRDNVVTCVRDIKKGEAIVYQQEGSLYSLIATENIPYCHKAALKNLLKNSKIIKYGEMLGKTTQDICRGGWVNEHNLISVPRDYASEMVAL